MLSFFGKGDQKKPGSGGPVVRRVITKKPIPPKSSTNTGTSTPSRPLISSSYKNGSSSTQSKPKPYASSSSNKGKEKASLPSPRPASSPVKRPVKRKIESTRIESESESDSESGEDATALFGSTKKAKRTGLSSTPRPLAGEECVGKDRVLFRYRDEGLAGEWKGFTPGEEIVNGVRKGWENKGDDEGRVRSLLDKYAPCTFVPSRRLETWADIQISHRRALRSRIHCPLLSYSTPLEGVVRGELNDPRKDMS